MTTARQLEIFLAVAERGSIRSAADALNISQPSVSRQLQALERAVGGELIVRRRGSKARLSALGASLLSDAKETLQYHGRLHRRAGPSKPASPTIYVRSFLLNKINEKIPQLHEGGLPRDTRFVVADDNEDFPSLVESREGTFCLIRSDVVPTDRSVIAMVVRSETSNLFCSPDAIANANSRNLDVLVLSQNPKLEAWTRKVLDRQGWKSPKIVYSSQFVEHLIDDVVQGRGCAVLFDESVADLVREGKLVRISSVSEPHYLVLLANKAADQNLFMTLAKVFQIL